MFSLPEEPSPPPSRYEANGWNMRHLNESVFTLSLKFVLRALCLPRSRRPLIARGALHRLLASRQARTWHHGRCLRAIRGLESRSGRSLPKPRTGSAGRSPARSATTREGNARISLDAECSTRILAPRQSSASAMPPHDPLLRSPFESREASRTSMGNRERACAALGEGIVSRQLRVRESRSARSAI
jgi:hypothetical protein